MPHNIMLADSSECVGIVVVHGEVEVTKAGRHFRTLKAPISCRRFLYWSADRKLMLLI